MTTSTQPKRYPRAAMVALSLSIPPARLKDRRRNVCAVDLLRSNHGPVIMEVNSSPGLEGVEAATGKDIACQIIEFIEANAKAGKTKTKGAG